MYIYNVMMFIEFEYSLQFENFSGFPMMFYLTEQFKDFKTACW